MKYCSKCGSANVDEAVFCSSCGTPLEQAPAAPQPEFQPEPVAAPPAAPQQSVYSAPVSSAPAYSAPAYSAPAAAPVAETKNKAMLWLILNIVSTVLCCFVFGIIGIIMAALGMGAFNRGDYEEMNKKSKIAMIMFIIGAIAGLITWIIVIIVAVSGGFAWLTGLANYY